MKKRFIAMFFALVLALTACGGNSSTPEPTPSSVSDTVSDAQFAAAVRDNTNSFDLDSDSAIVSAAHSVCDAWGRGVTLDQAEAALQSDGMLGYDSGYLMGAATRVYCPQYLYKFDGLNTSNSVNG